MSFDVPVDIAAPKEQRYKELIPQIESLVKDEPNLVANLANICAVLNGVFDFFWVGFYLVDDEELVLGPFQGPLACTRIGRGKGVCGKSWNESLSILVEDVSLFQGHIACNPHTRSEIVVPIIKEGNVLGVLDVDSDLVAHFDEIDKTYLEQIASIIATLA
jgi:GAF domain-containing protein